MDFRWQSLCENIACRNANKNLRIQWSRWPMSKLNEFLKENLNTRLVLVYPFFFFFFLGNGVRIQPRAERGKKTLNLIWSYFHNFDLCNYCNCYFILLFLLSLSNCHSLLWEKETIFAKFYQLMSGELTNQKARYFFLS